MDEKRYAVFKDKRGNRMIFPSVYEQDADENSSAKYIDWAWCRATCCGTGLEEEKERHVAHIQSDGNMLLPHIETDLASPCFAHGGTTVWIIGGPIFDEVSKGEKQNG